MNMGKCIKTVLAYKERWWHSTSGFADPALGTPITLVFDVSHDNEPMLATFFYGDNADEFSGDDNKEERKKQPILGAQRLVGVSTHSIEQARQAVLDGADYIGCGPVFPGQTKQFTHYVGTGLLNQVANEIDLPAFAIGGIDATNLPQITAAQFHRIAVAGVVRDAEDPIAVARELKQQLS